MNQPVRLEVPAIKLYYALHLHSCLSPCGDDDATPANLAGMCALAGLEVVALTDHNTCGNCRAFQAAAEKYGLLALCGMELTTAEEIHVVCLFPDADRAEAFSALVYDRLPPFPNDKSIFGAQLYMDEADGVRGEEDRLLSDATSIGVYEVCPLVESFDGVCFPAHIDRPSYSLLSQLGLWDPSIPFPMAEVSLACPPNFPDRPDLKGVPLITDSDAHALGLIPDAIRTMDLPEKTAAAVLDWIRQGGNAKFFT